MGSKLKGTGVQFPDGSLQTTAAASSISTMQIFYASTTFNKPDGVTRLEVTLVGGGAAAAPLDYSIPSNTYYGTIAVDTAGYPEFFGSPTSIQIEGTTHKARGGWLRTDMHAVTQTDLNIHERYGGRAGYLGENGFAGKSSWKGLDLANAGGGSFGSYPEYPTTPLAFGGSGYGYEGGSWKQYAEGIGNITPSHGDGESWAGGAGGYNEPWTGGTNGPWATNLVGAGNGGGSSFGSLGGNLASGIAPNTTYTINGAQGGVGGGGGFCIFPSRGAWSSADGTYDSNTYSGGGGGGAGAGGGGGTSRSHSGVATEYHLYGGAAGQVVTFQIEVPSVATGGYSVVIGTGGDGLHYQNFLTGGGGQGVVIIKY